MILLTQVMHDLLNGVRVEAASDHFPVLEGDSAVSLVLLPDMLFERVGLLPVDLLVAPVCFLAHRPSIL